MKLVDAINELMSRIKDLLAQERYSDFMLERVYRIKEHIVEPVARTLEREPRYVERAERLRALYKALEEYVVCFASEPDKREERRRRIEGLRAWVRRDILRHHDKEGAVEELLDDIRKWQWSTTLDEEGRVIYTTADGAVLPARNVIATDINPEVIEQAVKAQKPYSERARPLDVRSNPGGLLTIRKGKRAIIVGDLHGRYDNLLHILKDKNNLKSLLTGEAHLIFTGDAIHPRSSVMNSSKAYEDSFCVMLLIMTLKAENPFNVHYLIGNHDNAHVGGRSTGKGAIRQDRLFERYTVDKFGPSVFEGYREFVKKSPVVASLKAMDESIVVVHAGLTPRVLGRHGLINLLVKGRRGYELQKLLWTRDFRRETLRKSLDNVGVKFIISGHTNPTSDRAERYGFTVMAEDVFAHVHNLQVILNAQRNVFGYLDFDMTGPLPERVTDLHAPDGRSAFRMLRPKKREQENEPPDESAPT